MEQFGQFIPLLLIFGIMYFFADPPTAKEDERTSGNGERHASW